MNQLLDAGGLETLENMPHDVADPARENATRKRR
jgi:hypothetical protein